MKPDPRWSPDYKICDRACGTGGFLVAAYQWLLEETNGGFERREIKRIKTETYYGQDLVSRPRRLALMVMNGVLNGFGGRLFNTLRSQKGLAYSVSGRWQPGFDYPGSFVAGGQTRTETTAQFIDALKAEIQRLRVEPITEKELAYAKESILNSFIFNFEKPQQTLGRLMTYDYYGYPQDFIFEYQRRVKETTIADTLPRPQG